MLRIVAIAIWIVFMIAMASWSETTSALVGAGLATFALGAVVGRWWVLLTVLIAGLALSVLSAAAETEDTGHGSGVEWAVWIFVPATLLVAGVMALGDLVVAWRWAPGDRGLPADRCTRIELADRRAGSHGRVHLRLRAMLAVMPSA